MLPGMGQGQHELGVDRPADEVWAVVSDFGGLDAWMPGIESCELEGDTRKLSAMGMEITEQLRTKDDATRTLAYSVVGLPGLESHLATITVHPDGDTSRVTWAFEAEPDSMSNFMDGTYKSGIEALKKHCET
jgi:carbon monoxide dehydrogenase subunit G